MLQLSAVFKNRLNVCSILKSAIYIKYTVAKKMLSSINTTVIYVYFIYNLQAWPLVALLLPSTLAL